MEAFSQLRIGTDILRHGMPTSRTRKKGIEVLEISENRKKAGLNCMEYLKVLPFN